MYNGNSDLSVGPSVRGGEVGMDVLPAASMNHVNTAVREGMSAASDERTSLFVEICDESW